MPRWLARESRRDSARRRGSRGERPRGSRGERLRRVSRRVDRRAAAKRRTKAEAAPEGAASIPRAADAALQDAASSGGQPRSAAQNPRRLPKEPPRCCPGEGVRRSGHFCHAPRASITSAVPTTLTLPTHGLDAGAAWLTEQHPYPTARGPVFQEFWHRELCKFLNLPVRGSPRRVATPSSDAGARRPGTARVSPRGSSRRSSRPARGAGLDRPAEPTRCGRRHPSPWSRHRRACSSWAASR